MFFFRQGTADMRRVTERYKLTDGCTSAPSLFPSPTPLFRRRKDNADHPLSSASFVVFPLEWSFPIFCPFLCCQCSDSQDLFPLHCRQLPSISSSRPLCHSSDCFSLFTVIERLLLLTSFRFGHYRPLRRSSDVPPQALGILLAAP